MNAADGAVPVDAAPRTTDELIARLSRHAATAADRLAGSFQPNPAQGIGFIDAIAVDDLGLTWVIGWIMDDAVFDRPLIIVDEVPHAAGFACALVERGDVPTGGRGFVGVIDTQWQASASARPRFLLADESGRYLESVAPTPIRTKRAIAPVAREMLDRFVAGHGVLLRELFQTVHSWEIPDEAGSGDAVFVDEVAILPGFGALVTGWALSPSKQSDRFTLKAGNRIIAADELSVARFARPDLAHLHGNITLALARAGFTATFRGDLSEVRLNEMVLKGGWADGSSTNVAVPPENVRLLGVTVPIDHALAHYPALEAERFFPDFAHHAAIAARNRATTFSTYEAQPVAAALILALPTAVSDLFLMIDGALRNAAILPADWGIVLIGCPDGVRSLLVSLFADLKRVTGRRCSLFLTPPGDTTNDVVPGVIEALGSARFAFVSADALLADRGWAALGGPLEPFALLEIRDAAADETVEGTAGLNAFVCDAEAWRRIASSASPRIGGVSLDAVIPLGFSPQQIVSDAALALGIRRPSALVTAINDCGVTANV